jgi:threonine-phosphate decarboxylase
MIQGHGGNKGKLAQTLGCTVDQILDMSCNLNPLGVPDHVTALIRDNLNALFSLPEPDAAAMAAGFARFHDMPRDHVAAGSGTTFFIYTLPWALKAKTVLILGPTYADYQDGCAMHSIPWDYQLSRCEARFQPDLDALSRRAGQYDLVFICNPNNPTGTLISGSDLICLVQDHPDTWFVVDESYLPFVPRGARDSLVSAWHLPNLLVLSSMSKIFSIPGLRTGFLSGSPRGIQQIMTHYQPWSVNALAQAVVTGIFDAPEKIVPFYKKSQAYLMAEKQTFFTALAQTPGITLFDTATCFVLARLSQATAPGFCQKVGNARILIRDCSNFYGLSNRYIRFSLKTRPVNQKLICQIKQVLGHE